MSRMTRAASLALCAAAAVAAVAIVWVGLPPRAGSPPEDLGASIRAALAEGDLLERFERTASLLQHLDSDNLPGVLAVYDQMLSIVGESDIRAFVAAWARFDPLAALEHTRAWPFRPKQEIGVEAAIHTWALRDPTAARLAMEEVGTAQPYLSEKLYYGLVAGWVFAGAKGLDRYIAGLPESIRDNLTVVAVGTLMRKGGAEAARDWVDGILRDEAYDDGFKRSAFRRGIRSVARWYPEQGAAWAQEHAGKAYASEGPRIVGEQWGRRDGRAAMQWLREQPAGKPREQAVRQTFVEWLKADARGATEWLRSETLTAFHDPALELYASRIDHRQPEEAIGWCDHIVDAERRTGCYRAAVRAWSKRDAAAAEAWLQQSPLDEAARDEVRRYVEIDKRKPERRPRRPRPEAGPQPPISVD